MIKEPGHIKLIASLYVIFFLICFLYYALNGMLLYELQPGFYISQLDLTRQAYYASGLWEFLSQHKFACILADLIYVLLPCFYILLLFRNSTWRFAFAWFMIFYNLLYSVAITAVPLLPFESYTAFTLFPLLFTSRTETGFYFNFHFLRYIFLFIFFSAGLFKILGGGLFNPDQLGGALLTVHKDFLLSDPAHYFSRFISFIIYNTWLGYTIFFFATLLQLSFGIGFFTRKYDRLLQFSFVLFLITDLLLMRINYIQVGIYLLLLWPFALKRLVLNTSDLSLN